MERPPLVFWFDSPPTVTREMFNYVARNWGGDVIFVCHREIRAERRELEWHNGVYEASEVLFLQRERDLSSSIATVLDKYPSGIHVFAGFTGFVGRCLDILIGQAPTPRILVFSERPGVYGPLVKRILKRLYLPITQRRIFRKYGALVGAFLPLGQSGVESAIRYGWKRAQVFNFMYCPPDPSEGPTSPPPTIAPMRLIYVGRFSRFTKGTDTLIEAVKRLEPGGWNLTLVGGYGDYSEETKAWAETRKDVEYLGPWPAHQVALRMRDYDVCIVPSKFDGWNVVVNEALAAGIGVIVTDQAVSDELITASGAGLVIPANSAADLSAAIKEAVADRSLVSEWKRRARRYFPRITDEAVGQYFIDIVAHSFLSVETPRPVTPWIQSNGS